MSQTSDKTVRILLIEDNPDDAFLIQQMLADAGTAAQQFEVAHCERLSLGLDRLGESKIDVLLLDLSLPDSYGLDTFNNAYMAAPDVPILVLSGLDNETVALSAVQEGAQDYLIKGQVNGNQLARAIRYAIERKRVQEALRQLNATLEAQVAARTAEIVAEKDKSEAILRSAGDAIAMVDLEMRIQYVNDAFTTLMGYTAQEALGQPIHFVAGEGIPEQTWKSLRHTLARCEMWRGETIARRKDGRSYDAALSIAPMKDADGRLIGYVTSHQDVSRQKELDRARSQFIANVSHELRTPVTAIKLYISLLEKQTSLDKVESYRQVLEEKANQLVDLIQDVLFMTELDSGEAVRAWETVLLSALARDLVLSYQRQAKAANLSLKARTLTPDLSVRGDPERLGQALAGIVENAIAFTPGGGQIAVEVDAVEAEGERWATVAVRDTGPGISTEEQKRVFDRFFRGELAESGHVPGSGLGLSIAHEIVRAHGGRITVESDGVWGRGSVFTLWLRINAHNGGGQS